MPIVEHAPFDDSVLFEQLITCDGSGQYVSDWMSTDDVARVRLGIGSWSGGTAAVVRIECGFTFNPATSNQSNVYEGGPATVFPVTATGFGGPAILSSRYWRLAIHSAAPDSQGRVTVRVLERNK